MAKLTIALAVFLFAIGLALTVKGSDVFVDSATRVATSARIPKFSWSAGETFSAQLWLLNDTTDVKDVEITATLTIEGKALATLSWKTGETFGNKLGPTLNAVLPDTVHLSELKLTLTSSDINLNSEYYIHYSNPQKIKIVRQMNA